MDNSAPNLQRLIYYSKYIWQTGTEITWEMYRSHVKFCPSIQDIFSISIFPVHVIGRSADTYDFDGKNKNCDDIRYKAKFYMESIYQVSPDSAESTLKTWFFMNTSFK